MLHPTLFTEFSHEILYQFSIFLLARHTYFFYPTSCWRFTRSLVYYSMNMFMQFWAILNTWIQWYYIIIQVPVPTIPVLWLPTQVQFYFVHKLWKPVGRTDIGAGWYKRQDWYLFTRRLQTRKLVLTSRNSCWSSNILFY